MKKTITAILVASVLLLASCTQGTTASGSDNLSLEAQFDLTGKAPEKSFLTVKGSGESVEKDSVDTATGASKNKGTEVLNSYRGDADGKSTLPAGIQSLLKYGVSPESAYVTDAPVATKDAEGVITVQYLHRGRAYKMVSDKAGQFAVPTGDYLSRVIAALQADGSNLIAPEFSATGKVENLDWSKVWDTTIAAGTVIATVTAQDGTVTEIKTGAVISDVPASATPYVGTFQVTLEGTFLTLKGDLTTQK